MKIKLEKKLVCPSCSESLELKVFVKIKDEIIEGILFVKNVNLLFR